MGMYDEFGKNRIQIKAGPCEMKYYSVGDDVPLSDGIYVGYEGCIVVKDGKFVAEFEKLTDKYGGVIDTQNVFTNPLQKIIDKIDSQRNDT